MLRRTRIYNFFFISCSIDKVRKNKKKKENKKKILFALRYQRSQLEIILHKIGKIKTRNKIDGFHFFKLS